MKRLLYTINFVVFYLGISNSVMAQAFLNGSFEINTAAACDYNMTNASFTTKMANSTAYGGGGELDIMQTTCPYGPSQFGTWFVGLAAPSGITDAFTTMLSAPLVAGTSYTMSFYDKGDIACCPPGMPVIIGISTVAGAAGTAVYTGPIPTGGVWNLRCFTFVAPNNGQHISISTAGPTRWSHVDHFVMGGTCPVVLPIEYVSFKSICQNNEVVLNWKAANERNNDYYTVERSVDGKNFMPIGKIIAERINTKATEYTFTDTSPLVELSYYRLAQTDFDGGSTYSAIISTEDCRSKLVGGFEVFPNPVNDALNINVQKFSPGCHLYIFNYCGEMVFEKAIESASDQIDLSGFTSGIYSIKIMGGETPYLKKFAKN